MATALVSSSTGTCNVLDALLRFCSARAVFTLSRRKVRSEKFTFSRALAAGGGQSVSLTAAAIITERSAHTVTHPYMTAWESQSKWWYWTMIVTIINGGQCLPRGLSCALAARDFHQLISRELAVVVVDRARVVILVVQGKGKERK